MGLERCWNTFILPHYSAHIAGQITSTRRSRQILARIQPVRVYHEISIAHINFGRFGFVFLIEKFGQRSLFDFVQASVVEPCRV